MSVKAGQAQPPPGQAQRSGGLIGQGSTRAETRSALQESPQFQGNPGTRLSATLSELPGHAVLVSEEQRPKHELAIEVVVAVAAGVAGLKGPEATAVATGVSPLATAALVRISETIRSRRLKHAAETVMDGADAFGAETVEQFVEFIEAAVSDEEHQEL